ncbi:intradiol ring-cleavage dioxygenase [Streptomyces sp. M19]
MRRRSVLLASTAAAAAVGLGAAGAAAAARPATTRATTASAASVRRAAVCTLARDVTEGPYYLDGALVRSDVTEDKEGAPLKLAVTVVDDSTCEPLDQALVEIWYADGLGEYSGFVGSNGHDEPDDRTFLRGGVLTGADGLAEFTGIYPGWYRGRCIHIHLKVHTGVELTDDGSFTGGEELHTGQLFFDESVTEAVAEVAPYDTNEVPRTTLDQDGIYDGGGTASGLLALTPLGDSAADGYAASITVGVSPS